jgi:hypothetical protein
MRVGVTVDRGIIMRVMARITVPVEPGSQAIKNGSLGKLIQTAAERWKPEAMYFGASDGRRTAFVVFDLPDPSDMIAFCEPWFMEVNADVEIIPVMSGDDVQKGLAKLG